MFDNYKNFLYNIYKKGMTEMKKKEIIKEDIRTLEGLRKQFIKKGKFELVKEIEEEIKIMKDMLEREVNKNVMGRFN